MGEAVPLRSDWSTKVCPIARSLDLLGDPWSLLVLREVFAGTRRYDTLRGRLGIADNILADRLKRLVEGGLLVRQAYGAGTRPRTEYCLTEAGADALPVLHALAAWGNKHTASPTGEPMRVLCRACGHDADSADRCAHCHTALTPENVAWIRPSFPGDPIALDVAAVTEP
jgi:DNA-binding HxlR family transcriptional regulator